LTSIRVLINIYYYTVFGKGIITLCLKDQATIKDALNELTDRFGETFELKTGRKLDDALKSPFNIFLNEKYIDLPSDLGRRLTDEDKIVILRPVSGG
jgi:molybdopterin converting factor small subunit